MPHLTPSEVKGLFLEVLGEMQDEGVIGDKTRQERDEDDHNGEGQQDDQDGRRGREEDEDQVSNEEDDSEIDDSQILHGYVLLRDGVRAPHPLRSSGESLEDTPADLINTTLFPHQREAVGRLASLEASRYKGGILADEMGLGKTITLVALMLVRRTEPRHPTLVIVPPALLSMWTHELTTRAPSLKPYVWHGKRAKSITSTDLVREHHVVLTTYPMVRGQMKDMDRAENSDKQCSIPIMAILWGRIILDEAHTIRNIETNISIAVQSLQSSTRIAATGTPLQNEYSDVYSLLAFLNITPLSDYGFFKALFVRKKRRSRHFDKLIGTRNAVLAVSLRAVTIRRRIFEDFNGEPITDVQKPIIHLRHKSLNSEQMEYQEAVKHVWDEDERNRRILHGVGEGKDTQLLSKILQARLACVHPLCATARVETSSNEAVADLLQLFDIAHQREDASEVDTNRAEARAKFRSAITHNWKTGRTQQCVDLVKERIGQGSILIFSDFVSVLDVIEAGLNESQIELMRFDGTMTRAERDGVVQRFQTSDKPLVLLITSTCGGQGLTLTKANTVITLGPVWNPYVAEQCIARANRIGQKSRVDVFHLICYNSIERRALVLQDMKIAKSNTLIEMETVSDEALEYMRSCDIDKYRQTIDSLRAV